MTEVGAKCCRSSHSAVEPGSGECITEEVVLEFGLKVGYTSSS